MAAPRVLVVVLAGGAGSRLGALTDHRAKPALPFGGSYRLVDVPLSNCTHSGLADVWVLQQSHGMSLSDHLANGRPWDLDRTTGGVLVVHPELGTDREGFHAGTADALWRHAAQLRQSPAEAVVVVSADAVYRLDYFDLVAEHLAAQADADVTMVTTRVPATDAGRYGVVQVSGGRVTDYAYKPDEPASDLVCNEVFVFTPGPLLDRLEALGEQAGEDGLEDLGTALLPALAADGRAREHRHTGYWRDVGTVQAYWEAHQDLLGSDPAFLLDDPAWPLLTRTTRRAPAHLLAGAEVADSLLSAGCIVAGRVQRSVLGPGVRVESGAEVVDAVLLDDVVVPAGARVRHAVIDAGLTVAGAVTGGADDIAVIGAGSPDDTD